MTPIQTVAMRIKTLREKRGLTKRQLAEAAGISYGYLWRLEAARHDPTLSVLEKLAKALRVKIGALVK
jgi:XRE family aerobic/anaerobic benzoate catabolism transcriptional regulator